MTDLNITTVRYRRLQSKRDGSFGHDAIEAEAQVEPGQDPDVALQLLQDWVDQQPATIGQCEKLNRDLQRLMGDHRALEGQRDSLRKERDRLREIVRESDKLMDAARAAGLNDVVAALFDDGIPF